VRRWGLLWHPLGHDLDKVVNIVQACWKLHNFCLRRRIGVSILGMDSTVDEDGVLVNREWRDLPHDLRRGLRCENPVKDLVLELVRSKNYSHLRSIS
jgi:hypothetical protein